MVITKKDYYLFLLIGLTSIIFGIVSFWIGWVNFFAHENDFFPAMERVIRAFLVIYGIVMLVKYFKTYQNKEYHLSIKDDKLYINDKTFDIKNKNLTYEFKKDAIIILTLRNGKKIILKNVVLSVDEFVKLLTFLKPYLKNQQIFNKKLSENIKLDHYINLFEDGFTLNNRFFKYDEIKDINTQIIDSLGNYYYDFEIIFKNGEKIQKRLINGTKEYAKMRYVKLKFLDLGNIDLECEKPKTGIVFYTILLIDISLPFLMYYNEDIAGILFFPMLFISYFYLTNTKSDEFFEYKLCKETQKIIDKFNKKDNA
jgi:hypothetical protein